MITNWIQAQQIGLVAYTAQWHYRINPLSDDAERVDLALADLLRRRGWPAPASILTLPLAVLNLLMGIPSLPGFPDLQHHVMASLTELTARNRRGHGYEPAPIDQITVLAHHIMHGAGPETRITRLARSLFRTAGPISGWRQIERERRVDLADVLNKIRDRAATIGTRIGAIEDLSELVKDTPYATQLTNLLLHHAFSWPLVIATESDGMNIALTVPVGVDVEIPDEQIRVPLNKRHKIVGNENIEIDRRGTGPSFRSVLRHAGFAARVLWRNQRGHYGSFRHAVRNAIVTYDFGVASKIVGGVFGTMSLEDASAGAYFSQAVLARLMGKEPYLSSAVTGAIGTWARHRDGSQALDFEFLRPEGLSQKLAYVFDSRMFERVVVPVDDLTKQNIAGFLEDSSREVGVQQTAEVVHAGRLTNVADAVQGQWRKTVYVRSPDIAWVLHGEHRPRPMPSYDGRVTKAQQAMRDAEASVVSMTWATGEVVAAALLHLNRQVLPNLRHYPSSDTLSRPVIPPGLSWAFIRAVKDEKDERFWEVFWEAIGAPMRDFDLVRSSPSSDIAAARIAKALNRFVPERCAPGHRAPDLLVIIGLEALQEDVAGCANPMHRPLAVPGILKQLQELLQLSESRRWPSVHSECGPVRIILVPESEPTNAAGFALPVLDENKCRILTALATPRWGFTQQVAAMLLGNLGIKGIEVRETLDEFIELDLLRRGQGLYHMPWQVRQHILAEAPTTPRRHFAAGVAFAPYAWDAEAPGLAYDRALLPANVHEAEYHLAAAIESSRDDQLKESANYALQRVHRFAVSPGWLTVHKLLKGRVAYKDAYEIASDLIDATWSHPDNKPPCIPPHPVNLRNAAVALSHWTGEREKPEAKDEILRLFEDAVRHCTAFPEEKDFNLLQVLPYFSSYLAEHRPDLAGRLNQLNESILALLDKTEPGTHVPGEWFEGAGDSEQDHAKAVRYYLQGLDHAPKWYQLWLKAAGAASISNSRLAEVRVRMAKLSEEERVNVLSKSRVAYRRQVDRGSTHTSRHRNASISSKKVVAAHVRERWEAAIVLMLHWWGDSLGGSDILNQW